jgi:major membrane immunogen (membrane-anchored lipoprotein)
MKLEKKITTLIVLFCLIFTACKKKDNPTDVDIEKFDINNPAGYYIYVKYVDANREEANPLLFKFNAGKTMTFYKAGRNGDTLSYDIIDGNTIYLGDISFTIDNGKITRSNAEFTDFALIKDPETNQLAGKTFTGTYYKFDGSAWHQNYFYSFSGNENKVSAGINAGSVQRTENYIAIGNIAAWVDTPEDYRELMVLVNGKLEVGHFSLDPRGWYHGSFTKQ